jgi:hypothetical protein
MVTSEYTKLNVTATSTHVILSGSLESLKRFVAVSGLDISKDDEGHEVYWISNSDVVGMIIKVRDGWTCQIRMSEVKISADDMIKLANNS